ncbi:hypothetical protein ACSSS7_005244 [Eimeria intestinalis]
MRVSGGILVWINKHIFNPSLSGPLLHGAPKKPLPVEEPFAAAANAADLEEQASPAAAAAAAAAGGEDGPAAAAVSASALRRYRSTEEPLSTWGPWPEDPKTR